MKSNPVKCHVLASTNDNVIIRIGNFLIEIQKGKALKDTVWQQAVFQLLFVRNIQKS